MKMNKKGFTLIEMLVVIAIIAIMVAIVVPTVSNSTSKAKAASDAANLRTAMAEAQIYVLNNNITADKTFTAAEVSSVGTASQSGDGAMVVKFTGSTGKVDAYFGSEGNNLAHYAALAGTTVATGGSEG